MKQIKLDFNIQRLGTDTVKQAQLTKSITKSFP